MKRAFGFFAMSVSVLTAASCGQSGDPYADEFVSSTESFLTKCQNPAANGQGNFCDDPACPCDLGEGDCDADSQCAGALACRGKGTRFGFPTDINVCSADHCNNKRKDGDETKIDCGGSCGTFNCPATDACDLVPPNGTLGHCTTQCPCSLGHGNCAGDTTCSTGLVCAGSGTGVAWGMPNIRVCQAPHCSNGVRDGNEVGPDCGGSCAPCGGAAAAATRLGGTGTDTARTVAYDSAGNVIVAGRFSGTINLGGSPLTSAGSADIFVAKFTAAGAHVWSRAWGGTGPDADHSLELDIGPSDTVYVGGNYYYAANFGGGVLTAADTSDAFLVKLDANGNHLWSRRFGGARGDKIQGVAVDTNGTVTVTGSFQESINLGGQTFNAVSAGVGLPWDIFVAKFDANGNHVWSHAFGSVEDDQGTCVTLDAGGDAYVGGFFSSTINFGPSTLTATNGIDALAMRLSRVNGSRTWVRRFGGIGGDRMNAVASTGSTGLAFAGSFRTSIEGTSGPIQAGPGQDGFVAVLSVANGSTTWLNTISGDGHEHVTGVAMENGTRAVAITGYFQGTITATQWGGATLASAGSDDVFVVRYDPQGAVRWARSYGSAAPDHAYDLDYFNKNLVVVGGFEGSLPLSGITLTSAGGSDGFIIRQPF